MKPKMYLVLILVMIFNLGISQNASTYQIEKLSTPKNLLWQSSSEQLINNYNVELEKSSLMPDSLVYFGENTFLATFITAYQDHRPLIISPDMVWLLISQGFARHITFNAEKFRDSIVDFDSTKTLKITDTSIVLGLPETNWEKVFPQFISQINDYTGSELTNMLTADFTTTTATSKIVSQITIMETLKGYFNYEIEGRGCGIPSITIEGTVEDWQKILKKVKYISKFDLTWWTSELEPIINEFINAKSGKFNKEFWMNMVKVRSEGFYGDITQITGWIIKFFPYYNSGKRTDFKPIQDLFDLPSEVVRVPFIFIDLKSKVRYDMEFLAGFMGSSQNKTDYTLKPEIGWIINFKGPSTK